MTKGGRSEELGARITNGEEESAFGRMEAYGCVDEPVWLFWVKSGLGCDGFGPTIGVDDADELRYATLARGMTNLD